MAEIRDRGKRRDGTTRWEVRIWDPNDPTRRLAKSFKNKSDAKTWVTTTENSFLTGTHVDPRRADRPFEELYAAFRETWVDLEPKSRVGYESVFRVHLLPEFGSKRVSAITRLSVQSYVKRLGDQGLAPGTVRNIYAALRACLNVGVDFRLIAYNPCTRVKLPKSDREPMLFLTPDEIEALARHAADPGLKPDPNRSKHAPKPKPRPQDGLLIMTAAYSGLRIGELLALRRHDIDVLRGTITVREALKEISSSHFEGEKGLIFGRTKTGAMRSVPLPRFLTVLLSDHLAQPLPGGTGAANDLVFPAAEGGPMRHNLWYRRHYKPAVRRALPPAKHGLRFHDLRHTCASLLIATGAHPKAIQERLGHSSITITLDRYGHLFPTLDAVAVEALDALRNSATRSQEAPPDLRERFRVEEASRGPHREPDHRMAVRGRPSS